MSRLCQKTTKLENNYNNIRLEKAFQMKNGFTTAYERNSIWVACFSIIIPLIIAFSQKEKSSEIKNPMDWDKVNDICVVVGFIFAIISFGFLYLFSQQFDSCIITTIEFSIDRTTSHHTINATALEYALPNCQSNTILNRDFAFAVLGIVGLTTPVVSNLAIYTIKH